MRRLIEAKLGAKGREGRFSRRLAKDLLRQITGQKFDANEHEGGYDKEGQNAEGHSADNKLLKPGHFKVFSGPDRAIGAGNGRPLGAARMRLWLRTSTSVR